MRRSRWIVLLVLAMLILCLFFACRGKDSEKKEGGSSATQLPSTEETAQQPSQEESVPESSTEEIVLPVDESISEEKTAGTQKSGGEVKKEISTNKSNTDKDAPETSGDNGESENDSTDRETLSRDPIVFPEIELD